MGNIRGRRRALTADERARDAQLQQEFVRVVGPDGPRLPGRAGRLTDGQSSASRSGPWSLVPAIDVASGVDGLRDERPLAPGAARERDEPGHHGSEPVAVTGQERDVDEQPDQPAEPSREVQPTRRDDGPAPGQVGSRPEVEISERRERVAPSTWCRMCRPA